MKRTVLIKLNVNDAATALVAQVDTLEIPHSNGAYKVWYDMGEGWMYEEVSNCVNDYSAILTWAGNKWGDKLVSVELHKPMKVDHRLIAVIDGFMENALKDVDEEDSERRIAYLQGRIEAMQQVKDVLTMPHIQDMWMKYFKVEEKH